MQELSIKKNLLPKNCVKEKPPLPFIVTENFL